MGMVLKNKTMTKKYIDLASEYRNTSRQNAALVWYHDYLFKATPNLVFKVGHLFRGEPLNWMARDISFSEIFKADPRIAKPALETLENETKPETKAEFLKLWEGSGILSDVELDQSTIRKEVNFDIE